ncbi:hypothetical protein PR048_005806 [Dryococelus australis]|uniref:Uncharacterized protein n=1 Tax=Dryococelus australis TaxID=614101 RepID=A0ABQ9I973_9NEOP|nr:hypothetical protein PR048_005806 [Dryococelus australis]
MVAAGVSTGSMHARLGTRQGSEQAMVVFGHDGVRALSCLNIAPGVLARNGSRTGVGSHPHTSEPSVFRLTRPARIANVGYGSPEHDACCGPLDNEIGIVSFTRDYPYMGAIIISPHNEAALITKQHTSIRLPCGFHPDYEIYHENRFQRPGMAEARLLEQRTFKSGFSRVPGCGSAAAEALAIHQYEPGSIPGWVIPESSPVEIVSDDTVGRCSSAAPYRASSSLSVKISIEVTMEQRRNARAGKAGDHRESPPTSDSPKRKFGGDPVGNRPLFVLVGGEKSNHYTTDCTGVKGRGKREIPEKTLRPKASLGTIPTCENPLATLMRGDWSNHSATVAPLQWKRFLKSFIC